MLTSLRCRICESEYPPVANGVCLRCFGPLEPAYDWDEVARSATRERIEAGPRSLWRYESLLPVPRLPTGRERDGRRSWPRRAWRGSSASARCC